MKKTFLEVQSNYPTGGQGKSRQILNDILSLGVIMYQFSAYTRKSGMQAHTCRAVGQ